MHTVCCEQLLRDSIDNIPVGGSHFIDTTRFETVPAIIEVRFTGPNPALGKVYTFNSVFNGYQSLKGVLVPVRDFTEVNLDYNSGLQSGFVVKYEQGVGRGLGIQNLLDTPMTNVFVTINRYLTLVSDSTNGKGP